MAIPQGHQEGHGMPEVPRHRPKRCRWRRLRHSRRRCEVREEAGAAVPASGDLAGMELLRRCGLLGRMLGGDGLRDRPFQRVELTIAQPRCTAM